MSLQLRSDSFSSDSESELKRSPCSVLTEECEPRHKRRRTVDPFVTSTNFDTCSSSDGEDTDSDSEATTPQFEATNPSALALPSGAFSTVSPEFAARIGYSLKELQTMTILDLTFKSDLDSNMMVLEHLFDASAHSSSPVQCLLRAKSKSGQQMFMALTLCTLDCDDKSAAESSSWMSLCLMDLESVHSCLEEFQRQVAEEVSSSEGTATEE